MAEIAPVNIRVNVDATGVANGVSVVENGLNQISTKAKAATGAFGNFKTLALGMFAGNILTQGLMGVTSALREAKQEMLDTEVATSRLYQALDGVGISSKATQKSVYEVADSYYQLGFQGSEAVSAMGTLVTATGDVEQANKLMAMSADLARYKHIDMETAAKILARGTQGSAKAFKELGITLDTTIPKNEAISRAFDQLNTKIGGQAVAYSKTFAGQMDILKEKFDNIVQTVGAKVLPIFSALLQYISKNGTALMIYGGIVLAVLAIYKTYTATMAASKAIQQAYAFWTYAQAASTSVFKFAMDSLNASLRANPIGLIITLVIALGVAFVWAWNRFEGFRKVVVKGIQIIVNGFGYLVGGFATFLKALGKVPGMGWAKKAGEAVDGLANKVRKYSDSLDSLANKKIGSPKIPGFVAPGSNVGIEGNVPGGDAAGKDGKGTGSQTVQYVTVYASNTNDIAKKLSKAAKHGQPIGAGR